MPDELIEKVARAICLSEHPNTMSPIAWKAYRDVAIAAFKAIEAAGYVIVPATSSLLARGKEDVPSGTVS